MMILPHGGKLVNRVLEGKEREEIIKRTLEFKVLFLEEERIREVKNIARGVFSPLTGFLREKEFQSVALKMRLPNNTIWPIPIVLDIKKEEFERIKSEKDILLVNSKKEPVALLEDIEIYENKKDFFAKNIFGTLDKNHPGVARIYRMGGCLVGGEIKLLDNKKEIFPQYNFTPQETRNIFKERGWEKIVAFQTRNVPHRGHEFLQKTALKLVDGLFIQPVAGKKKIGDFKDEYILAAYEMLLDRYYPRKKVLLGILPLEMRYGGPREALFHALIRKNFGCSHFIVGRDHAGVANYYPPFAAQEIFNNFPKEEIGIEILKYPEVIYCQKNNSPTFINDCPSKLQIRFSGTMIRKFIEEGKNPPFSIIRPEVYFLLSNSKNPLVDNNYQNGERKNAFTLWFTGLSQSGKTTLANRIEKILKKEGTIIERLDGDIVRQSLSYDLGFSKKDREENIRRVGTVAQFFNQRGINVIASFISPYRKIRRELRERIPNFIEVFCKAPLKVCEARDDKGLYAKARKGEIKNFTGISDPYEEPENPEIIVETDKETIEESTKKIIGYLREKKLI